MEYTRTRQAASLEKRSQWELIEAIALDAVDAGLPITGTESCVEAKRAFDAAGTDYADKTVKALCMVAKFDHEATTLQRGIFRNYGVSVIGELAGSSWSQEKAAQYLAGTHRTRREIRSVIRDAGSSPAGGADKPEPSLDDAFGNWLNRLASLVAEGAALAERAEAPDVQLGTYSELALVIYNRITESKLDAEIRQLLESEESEVGR